MRRAILAFAILLAPAAASAGAATAPAPRAALDGFVCQRAANHLDRAIEVVGVMRPMPATQGMAMKFVLLRRAAIGGPFLPLRGKDLGRWLTPKPATLGQRPSDVWRLDKLVVNLPSSSAYRFRVTFRWTGTGGALGRATLLTALCTQ